jgi:hypothetical protein
MPVNTLHPEYETYQMEWQKCRDASKGQRAIHAGGKKYLPALTNQSEESYKSYLMRALFYEATGRTVSGLRGMIFRKPPAIEENGMADFLTDVTMDGTDINNFAQDLTTNVLEVGRSGILIDHPTMEMRMDENGNQLLVTRAQIEAANMRPFFKEYKAESIINWATGKINNQSALTQVRLHEIVQEPDPDDEFGVFYIDQIRVLEINELGQYQQRLFRKEGYGVNKDKFKQYGDTIVPLINGSPLGQIPFIFVKNNSTSPCVNEPPLMGLVNVNLSHYLTTANLENGAHFTGAPTAVITGHNRGDEDVFMIGSSSAWVFSDPEAAAFFLEFKGDGLGTLQEMLTEKEAKMAALGAQMLTPSSRKNEAAETAEMRHAGENSVLSSISQTISEALNNAFEFAAEWMGVAPAVIKLNTDFMAAQMSPQMMRELLAAVQAGRISPQTYFENMKRGEIIDSVKSFEDEQAELETVPPAGI